MGKKIVIAAYNSLEEDKKIADFVCSGKNDEIIINKAIEMLTRGGTLQLLDGDYNIDSFEHEGNSAIFFGYNNGQARVINFIGDTENKGYNTEFGATIHVTEAAMKNMDPDKMYRVFYGTPKKPEAEGDFFTYTFVNNVNFENFFLKVFDASRQITGIDCEAFGSAYIELVGVYTESYHRDRYLHLKPATAAKNSIAINSCGSSNDEMARVGMKLVSVGGFHTGFKLNGVDRMVMQCCSANRCCYGYVFCKRIHKTFTMINCGDEGNTHLPHFGGYGHITCIDFNIERFNADYIPDDIDGNGEHRATVEMPDEWHGYISYTLQGKAYNIEKFWRGDDGKNFLTVDQKVSFNPIIDSNKVL